MMKEYWIHHGDRAINPAILPARARSWRGMRSIVAGVLTLVIVLPSPVLYGDEVDDIVNALKPTPVDYAVWAGNLLKATKDLKGKPETQVRLYAAAYELGLKRPAGYATSIRAAQALVQALPEEKLKWQQKLLVVLRLDWRRADRRRKKQAGRVYVESLIAVADEQAIGDDPSRAVRMYAKAAGLARYYAPHRRPEIPYKLKDAREQYELRGRLKRLQAAVQSNPKNLLARESLIRLLVVEFGQTASAEKLLTPDVSEVLRTYVPLAAREIDQVQAAACMELADWHKSLVAKATLRGKVRALTQAMAHYRRFLELEKQPARKVIAKAKLIETEKTLRQLGDAPVVLGIADVRELVIAAVIDGRSDLHVTPTGIHWEHYSYSKPGMWRREVTPILVNGSEWSPEWQNPKSPRGRDTSKPYRLRVGHLDFKLELLGGPDLPAVLKRYHTGGTNPGRVSLQRGEKEMIVSITDSGGGAGWYCFRLIRLRD